MTTTEHLLAKLNEECVEIAKDCCKAMLFGLDDRKPLESNSLSNREKIVNELNDLAAVVEMMEAKGIIPRDWQNEAKMFSKKEKVRHWMTHARKVGTLQ